MNKHAYLIIAHTDFHQLLQLVKQLDDVRNDIYIHIDRKANFDGEGIQTFKAGLNILPQRIDARWGDFSLVEVEYLLFEAAFSQDNYSYYHLLSGVDLAIRSQDDIHHYCEQHAGTEFIGFAQKVSSQELHWRSQHYFLFAKDFHSTSLWKRGLRAAFVYLQDLVHYRRSKWEVKKGAQWCSVTCDFVRYLLAHRVEIYKAFHHTYCPDELFIQTLCWNSPFKERININQDEFEGCKRYIPWKDGHLLPITVDDVELMMQSDKWFARKFSSQQPEVIEALLNKIQ